MRDEGGTVLGVLHVTIETTARVLAERARYDAERKLTEATAAASLSADFRALFEASPAPLFVVAPPDWTIIAANDARLRVTGTTREEQIGRRLFDMFPDDPDDPNADGVRNFTASLDRVVATRRPIRWRCSATRCGRRTGASSNAGGPRSIRPCSTLTVT